MMQKRTLYSLLLISFILVFAISYAQAQTVSFESKTVTRCEQTALNVSVDPGTDVSAIEVVFVVSSTSGGAFFDDMSVNWAPGLSSLTNRIVDMSGVDHVSPDTVRMAAMLINSGDVCLPAGQTTIATVGFTTSNTCSGTVTLDGGSFSCPSFTVSSQFVDCATMAILPASVTPGVVTVVNDPPTIAAIPNATIHWGDTYVGTAVGSDPDLANGCEQLTYSKVDGPAAMTVNANTGTINWTTSGADVCEHPVTIQVADGCGATASTSFTICVQNTPPEITCPADTLIALGTSVSLDVNATDPDGGPSALLYTLAGWTGPGTPTINPATGAFSWQTIFDDSYKGSFTATVVVSDGAPVCDGCSPANADTCSFTITVVNFLITIQKTHQSLQGQEQTVDVYMQDHNFANYPMGGFDFLFQYDASALTLQSAEAGQFLSDCKWEYFTYRYGANGNCGGSACPSGFVRVVAIAETNNGPYHPTCFTNSDPGTSNQLVVLHFLVTNDRTYDCMYAPVRFFWYDCGDNTISSVDGNFLFISNNVYNFEDTTGTYSINIADPSAAFPSAYGANSTCDVAIDDGKPDPMRFIDFVNGGVDIACADSLDDRGDINLNHIPYEIADAVLFSNYFIYGINVFTINQQGQIAATDVNADGLTLSVADLVYLIRVVQGDANPYPKEVVPGNAEYIHSANGDLAVRGDVQVGAAYVVAEGNVVPQLKATNMEIKYAFDGTNTRMLIWSPQGNSFSGDFLNVPGQIVSLEMADNLGNPLVAKWVPDQFELRQNYPNPFNPTTTISFTLPLQSAWQLDIYNINGQRVASYNGTHEAGLVELTWDASTTASGVYFYKLQAGSFSATKKMVLLK